MSASPREENFIKKSFRKYPLLSNIALMILSVIVVVFLLLLFIDGWTHHGATSVVPDVKHLSYEQAVDVLKDSNLETVIADSIYDDTHESGMVVEVWPKPGAVVKKGREVYVTIVAFSPRTVVIDMPLTNMSARMAMDNLRSLGIKNVEIKEVASQYNGLVMGVVVNGKRVSMGARVPVNSKIVLEVGSDGTGIDTEMSELNLDAKIDSALNSEDIIEVEPIEDPYEAPAEPAEPSTPVTEPSNPLYD